MRRSPSIRLGVPELSITNASYPGHPHAVQLISRRYYSPPYTWHLHFCGRCWGSGVKVACALMHNQTNQVRFTGNADVGTGEADTLVPRKENMPRKRPSSRHTMSPEVRKTRMEQIKENDAKPEPGVLEGRKWASEQPCVDNVEFERLLEAFEGECPWEQADSEFTVGEDFYFCLHPENHDNCEAAAAWWQAVAGVDNPTWAFVDGFASGAFNYLNAPPPVPPKRTKPKAK